MAIARWVMRSDAMDVLISAYQLSSLERRYDC